MDDTRVLAITESLLSANFTGYFTEGENRLSKIFRAKLGETSSIESPP